MVAKRNNSSRTPGAVHAKAQVKAGYDPVVTPHIGSKALYVTSGHYEKYGKDSFQPIHTPEREKSSC